jgi:hypothetical protein
MSILGNIENAIGSAAKAVGSVLPHVSNPKPTPMVPPNRAMSPARVPALGSSNMPFDTKAMPQAPQPMPYNTKTQPTAPVPLANSKPAPVPSIPSSSVGMGRG